MNEVFQSAFLEALGWSLVDSLWQMGGLWLLYLLLTLNGSKFSSSARHNLALIAVACGTLWFFFTLAVNYGDTSGDGVINALVSWTHLNAVMPFLSSLYLFAVALFSIKLFIQLKWNKNLYYNTLIAPPDNIADYLQRLCERLGITRKVSIWLSEKAESPLTIGFAKPLILVPVAALMKLTPLQAEAVIAHELFHIRRNDYLLNKLMLVTEIVLFFNPFARILLNIVKKERENCCDDQVLTLGFNAWEYSEALYLLGKGQVSMNQLVVSATGSGKKFLLARIKRMLNLQSPRPSLLKPLSAFFLCLLVTMFSARKQKPNLLAAAEKITPAVGRGTQPKPTPIVYIEQKRIEITKSTPAIVNRSFQKKNGKKPPAAQKPEAPRQVIVIADSDEESSGPVITFVSDPEVVEFSIIDHGRPGPPKPVTSECPLPYVPASAFYYPDSIPAAPEKTIRL